MRLEIESNVATPQIVPDLSGGQAAENENVDLARSLKQGIAAARGGDRASARALLLSVTEAEPRSADAWLWLASISENPEELLGFLNNVLEIDPENERARQWKTATCSILSKTFVQRGEALSAEGQFEFAEECFNSAISHEPQCESAWLGKAKLARDEAERVECLERVLRINPENGDARKALNEVIEGRTDAIFFAAQKAAVKGNRKIAEKLVDELLESDPSHLEAWTLRSLVSLPLDEKLLAFDRILEIDAENSYARSGHDFLVRVFDAAAQETADEATSPEVREFDTAGQAAETREEVEAAHGELDFADEPQESDGSQEALARTDVDVVPSPLLEFEHETIAEHEPLEIADGPATRETVDDTVFEQELTAGDNVVEVQFESAFKHVHEGEPGEHVAETEASDNGSPAVHYESAFTGQAVDDRIHEFLTEDSFTLPTGHEPAPDVQTSEFEGDAEEPEQQNLAGAPAVPSTVEEPAADGGADVGQEAFETREARAAQVETVTEPAEDINAALASFDPVETAEDGPAAFANAAVGHGTEDDEAFGYSCPFCADENDPQAFCCRSCHAVLSISDLDSLLGDTQCDRETVQQAVTEMEAEWNLREFSEHELTMLGIGQFNLNNPERGIAYLQEASRLNPNNVILAGQVNALVIRLDEKRRQDENHETMPKGKTILVVDDSPTVRKLISSKLEKSGHKVLTAVDGVDALEVMENVVPDLVLLDIAMPRMDGYSVCKLIRANEAVKKVPVVMISGKDGFFDKVRGRMAGTTAYITKPFGPETLMRALETYLLPNGTEATYEMDPDDSTESDTE